MNTYIRYFLPKSITSVAINKRKSNEAFFIVKEWLQKYAKFKISTPINFSLRYPVNPDKSIIKTVESINKKYGNYRITGSENKWPENVKTADHLSWEISIDMCDELFQYTLNNKNELKPLYYSIFIVINFLLLDKKGFELPYQSIENKEMLKSSFFLHLENSSSISPDINFPFFEYNKNFIDYYEYITKTIPFKMNEKYLRICTKGKNGNIITRKIL